MTYTENEQSTSTWGCKTHILPSSTIRNYETSTFSERYSKISQKTNERSEDQELNPEQRGQEILNRVDDLFADKYKENVDKITSQNTLWNKLFKISFIAFLTLGVIFSSILNKYYSFKYFGSLNRAQGEDHTLQTLQTFSPILLQILLPDLFIFMIYLFNIATKPSRVENLEISLLTFLKNFKYIFISDILSSASCCILLLRTIIMYHDT